MKIDPAKLDNRAMHELMVSLILPRPIALVSTTGPDGVYNAAPFSFFTVMSLHPVVVGFSIGRRREGEKKDTLVNIESSREFVINVVGESLAEQMNQTSGDYPSEVDEFKEAGLTAVKSEVVRPPRVAESPIHLECRLLQILEFGQAARVHNFVMGEAVLINVRDEIWADGMVKSESFKPIGRMGGDLYCRTGEIFEMKRPRV